MSFDSADARDEMVNAFFAGAWATDPKWLAMGFTAAPHIEFQGREGNDSPAPDAPYIIWAAKHADGGQEGFGDNPRTLLFENAGVIIMQCKAPLSPGNGFEVAERMAIIARNAYRGTSTPCGVWFRNQRMQEVGPDGGWFIFNAYIDFTYNEVG